jgi:hypothetical protein
MVNSKAVELAVNALKSICGREIALEEKDEPVSATTTDHIGRPQVPCVPAIPAGAILLAPRYDGGSRPLASIPKCWCCKTLYQLERLQEWKGQTYAWLKPGCGCLDTGMCYGCSLCWNHCRCSATDNDSRHKTSEKVFRTPTSDGGAG